MAVYCKTSLCTAQKIRYKDMKRILRLNRNETCSNRNIVLLKDKMLKGNSCLYRLLVQGNSAVDQTIVMGDELEEMGPV